MNELALERCRTVPEALELMTSFVDQHHEMMGGNHLLVDAQGNLAVLEHCDGKIAIGRYEERGCAARGNNSLLLIREAQERLPLIRDSTDRQDQMDQLLETQLPSIRAGRREEFLNAAKKTMASHSPMGTDAIGSICVHGLTLRGCRSTAVGPHAAEPVWTVTSMIFDIERRQMLYTIGNPCKTPWQTLRLM